MNRRSETRPPYQPPKPGPADPEREAAIVAMVEGGMSYRAVGRVFGISGARVGQIMNRSRTFWPDTPPLPTQPVTSWPTGHPSVQEMDDFLAGQEAARAAALAALRPRWRPVLPTPDDSVAPVP